MACFITVRAFDVKDNVPFLWSRAVSHKPAIESTPFSDMITKRTVWSEQTASIMLQPWIICVCTHIYMPKHLISLIIQCTKGIVSKWGVRDEKFASGLCFVVCFGGLFHQSRTSQPHLKLVTPKKIQTHIYTSQYNLHTTKNPTTLAYILWISRMLPRHFHRQNPRHCAATKSGASPWAAGVFKSWTVATVAVVNLYWHPNPFWPPPKMAAGLEFVRFL